MIAQPGGHLVNSGKVKNAAQQEDTKKVPSVVPVFNLKFVWNKNIMYKVHKKQF